MSEHKDDEKKRAEAGPKASYGYGGQFGVQEDRMDKVGLWYGDQVGECRINKVGLGFGDQVGECRMDKVGLG